MLAGGLALPASSTKRALLQQVGPVVERLETGDPGDAEHARGQLPLVTLGVVAGDVGAVEAVRVVEAGWRQLRIL
jgi:hypothetical protein